MWQPAQPLKILLAGSRFRTTLATSLRLVGSSVPHQSTCKSVCRDWLSLHRERGRSGQRSTVSGRFGQRGCGHFLLVWFCCLGVAGGLHAKAPASSSKVTGERLLFEVMVSLRASSVASLPLETLVRAGLASLELEAHEIHVRVAPPYFHLDKAEDRKQYAWPPRDEREALQIIQDAVRWIDGNRALGTGTAGRLGRAMAAAAGDPYTAYLSPQVVARLQKRITATPGIELSPQRPNVIREVRPGSDAAREGIVEGDRLILVDGLSAADMTLAELSAQLVGEPGTAMRVQFESRAANEVRSALLVRNLVPEPVVAAETLPDGILYLRISSFAPGAASSVLRAIWQSLPRGLILDIRHNQGGLIQEAADMLDIFFGDGLLGGVRPRQGRPVDAYFAEHQPTDVIVPMVVLIDGGTASAAELLALALQERRRAFLLGSRTLGKGSVQKVIHLPNGGALKVTSAYYTGPSGQPLPPLGVSPDRFLAPTRARTVLEKGEVQQDGWVLSAVDELHGYRRAKSEAVRLGPRM